LLYLGCSTRRYATAATLVLMLRFEIEAVLDTIADRRCDSEHMRSADPIAAPFPRIPTARSGCPRRRSSVLPAQDR
jgi:hypothetical protein